MVADFFVSLLYAYGYLGLFLVGFIGSASIFLILPTDIVVFLAGAFMNPLLVGVVSGVGKALGEGVGYALGRGGRKIIDRKYKKEVKKWEKYFKTHGGFLMIMVFAATPLPDDIVGIVGGTLKYPFKKFLLAAIIGKIILSLVIAYAGFYGANWILEIVSPFS